MTLKFFITQLVNVADRYFIVAGIAFLVMYVLLRKRMAWRKIQLKFPAEKDYLREIAASTISIIIFAMSPIIILGVPEIRVHTQVYGPIAARGWVYFLVAFPMLFLVHDTYFYWMHRMIHQPKLFKLIHLEHHRSVNPSPWAAYAFSPWEAFLESLIFPIILFTIPLTVRHVIIFFLLSIMYNVYGHLGFELYPRSFHRTRIGRWVNTSVSHNQHHRYFRGNYGLYFLFWDRWMGTMRPDYDKAFEEVTGRVKGIVVSGVLLLVGVAGVKGQVKADDITGIWLTHGDKPAKIQIYRAGQQYYGKIVFLQFPLENGKPQMDRKNPDKSLQGRPVLGLELLNGFRFDKDEWNDGHIYDPESGKTYSCTITLKDRNTLKVRGYIGISLFGRTEIWTRVSAP